MDTITHGVAGALLGKAFCDQPDNRLVRRSVIIGSVAPDLDMIGGWLTADELFQLEFHRGITHSIIALPAFALLLALATVRLTSPVSDAKSRWKLLALAYGTGLALHILFDLITAYGTMILQPVSMARYTFDMVFIIDLTLGAIVLIPQLVASAWSQPEHGARRTGYRRSWQRAWMMWLALSCGAIAAWFLVNAVGVPLSLGAIAVSIAIFATAFALPRFTRAKAWPQSRYCQAGLGLMILYLAACGFAHKVALDRVAQLVARNQLTALRIAALPAPPSLLKWSGLVQTDTGVTRFAIDLTDRGNASAEHFANTYPIPNEQKLHALPALQTYLWFARFPWVTSQERDGKQVVEYRDLQFIRPANRRDSPFTFRAQFDLDGNLISAGLAVL
ncbi:MAG: metal-dependent hydrolase [Acidobacteria bacterium]|nr:metal-dependent hydrolase [Acidobacteriota bacterium]